jgi:hypothetical protein
VSQVSATVTAYYLYETAESIRLNALETSLGGRASRATLYDKAPGAPRVRYIQPPVVVEGAALGEETIGDFRVRVKFYDYGVISLALTRPFAGDWPALVALGPELIENESIASAAEAAAQRIVQRVATCFEGLHGAMLDEEYLLIGVASIDPPMSADEVLDRCGASIAQLLRGERQPLSPQERDEVLRHRLSYLSDDLVVPAWNAAFIYDTEAGMAGAAEVLEFANSQLLEFRYHDERLESALGRIYGILQHPRWIDALIGRRYLRATRQVHALFIDVNELTDRTENALKLVGDVYSARLFTLAAARLGLDQWKRNVQNKLETLDDIYRFAVEQTRVSQGNILELVIVLILVFEVSLTIGDLLGW